MCTEHPAVESAESEPPMKQLGLLEHEAWYTLLVGRPPARQDMLQHKASKLFP